MSCSTVLAGGVLVQPGATLVVGANDRPNENGDYRPDVRATNMLLDNVADEIIVTCPANAEGVLDVEIDRVAWDAAWPIIAGQKLVP